MKVLKFKSIRPALLGIAIGIAPAAVLAQLTDPNLPPIPSTQPGNPNQQPPNPGNQDSTGGPGLTGQMLQDKLFLRTAVEGGLLEVKLGELAAKKASSPEVKDLGQKMVTDHAALIDDFGNLADSMGIMVPKKISKEGQAEYAKLESLSGPAFDTEYLTVMVKDHHQDLREFRQEFIATKDTALQEAIVKAGKVVREHTMLVDKLATEKGIPVPERKKPTAAPPTPPPGM